MAIEHAGTRVVRKPWGSTDLRPWSEAGRDGAAIGELWFQRTDEAAPETALLLKLLFTEQPLSIQVHPGDEFAHSNGLANCKSEAWDILAAAPVAEMAVGLKLPLSGSQLRAAIGDGSIAGLVQWRPVQKDDFIFVPAGTIHAIGKGLVVAEIQQRSDVTYRLFDHGRGRELHVDNAVAAATAEPAACQPAPTPLTDTRSLLVASPPFVVERIDLPPRSNWRLNAERETWVLVLEGYARIGLTNTFVGEAVFLEDDRASIRVGADGLKGLLAYRGPEPQASLLRSLDGPGLGATVLAFPRGRPRLQQGSKEAEA
jgi:mannose-6-phosphate isomerase